MAQQRWLFIIFGGIVLASMALFALFFWLGSTQARQIGEGSLTRPAVTTSNPTGASGTTRPTTRPTATARATPTSRPSPTARAIPTTASALAVSPTVDAVPAGDAPFFPGDFAEARPFAFDDFSFDTNIWDADFRDVRGNFNGYQNGVYAFDVRSTNELLYDIRAPLPIAPAQYEVETRWRSGSGEHGIMIVINGTPTNFAQLSFLRIGIRDGTSLVVSEQQGNAVQELGNVSLSSPMVAGGIPFRLGIQLFGNGLFAFAEPINSDLAEPDFIIIPYDASNGGTQIGFYANSGAEPYAAWFDNLLMSSWMNDGTGTICRELRSIDLIEASPVEGDDVIIAQQRLENLGYWTGGVDGVYGPITAAAVQEFQRLNTLVFDGNLDQDTWCRLLSTNAARADGSIELLRTP
jgi:hypothetical protein